ncbi:MAG: hypothetical protein ACRER3_14450, partial [Pseudomonas fluorescens]
MSNIPQEIFVNLFAVFLVFVARLLGFDIFSRIIRLSRRFPMFIRKLNESRTLIVFTDCDDELHATRALAASLGSTLNTLGNRVKTEIVRDGVDLARCPFSTSTVIGVVLLLTDVTQLSVRPRDRAHLQNRLVKYVHSGGCLILGHDVIYRRTRNERLQRLAGGVLDSFKRTEEPVMYQKVESGPRATIDADLLSALPSSLELGDTNGNISFKMMNSSRVWRADVPELWIGEEPSDDSRALLE